MAPHPIEDSDLVASGGEDDMAYIWKRGSGEVEQVLDQWGDSVCQVIAILADLLCIDYYTTQGVKKSRTELLVSCSTHCW